MSRVLYVAEPIDQSDFGKWKESVDQFIGLAIKRGWLVYRPARAWRVSPEDAPIGPEIEETNRMVMARAGALVAHLPAGVPSVGVPREVEWAVANSMPALVATDRPGWSLADVDIVEIGDLAGFGIWIKAAEAHNESPGYPISFLIDAEHGQLPVRANHGDAGYDLFVSEDTLVPPGEFVDVPCGVRVAFPPGVWGRIVGRSSTLRKRKLLVVEGVIDTGYRGSLYSGVQNLNDFPIEVHRGERIAQLVLHENVAQRHWALQVDDQYFASVPGDSRGTDGFGSTGV